MLDNNTYVISTTTRVLSLSLSARALPVTTTHVIHVTVTSVNYVLYKGRERDLR